jgi:hypothetical protein
LRTAVVAVLLFAVLAGRAAAAPIVLGPGESPDVYVDGEGTAFVAFNGNETGDPVRFCRLPRGASACDVSLTLPLPSASGGSTNRPVVHVAGTRVTVLQFFAGEAPGIWRYQSTDRGASFAAPQLAGTLSYSDSALGPGDTVSVVTHANGQGTLFQNVPLTGTGTTTFANLDTTRPAYGAVGLDGANPVVIAEDLSSNAIFRRYTSGPINDAPSWSAPVAIGQLSYPRLAGGPLGLWMMAGDGSRGLLVRRFDGSTFGAATAVGPGNSAQMSLFQDAGGRMHAVYPMLDAAGYHAIHAVSDDGVNWRTAELDAQAVEEAAGMRVSAAADHVGVAVWQGNNRVIKASAAGPLDPPPPVPPPPVPPPPDPLPEFEKSVVVRPVSGVVRVRLRGSSRFVDLRSLDDVPLGATIDTRRGRIELRAVNQRGGAVETVQLYDGMFKVDQKRGITNFTLNEPLAPCGKRGRAAAKKPKSRRLWGDGKGSFRTSGKYSAATVRGTRWLVRDSCAGTLTRVAQGSVTLTFRTIKVQRILRAGKSYLARPPRR